MKKILKTFLIFILCIMVLPIVSYGNGSDNADTGTGEGEGKAEKGGHYNSGEWMWKVTIYVGTSDKVNTSHSLNENFQKIGEPVFIQPSSFSIPNGTIFMKNNKADYLNGAGLERNFSPKVITDNKTPPPPITHKGGNINQVKSYFGDTGTLIRIIDGVADQQGTTREGLVSGISFTIDGKKGTKDPKDILPVKNEKGTRYTNQVPWTIVYEPVIIAHLNDGVTKLAFTATEYALAQKQGIVNFFFTGANAQLMAGMTHINLPNSVVLEEDWFGYKSYSPTNPKSSNKYWSDDRIINGGGWGMRFLAPNRKAPEEPEEVKDPKPKNPLNLDDSDPTILEGRNIGDYRVDTDVIISFYITTAGKEKPDRATPNDTVSVNFYVDGTKIGSMKNIVLPTGGGQYAWIKWHTPKEESTVTITAKVKGNAKIKGSKSQIAHIVDLNKNIPPDPVAKDPKTGKPVQAPLGYKVPRLPSIPTQTYATWGEWEAYWEPLWVWEDGEWIDKGDWEYIWHAYNASLTKAKAVIKPDEKVPTATTYYSKWQMGSGYGLNIDIQSNMKASAPKSSYTNIQNAVNYFPEFNYQGYWRLSDRVSPGKFKLKPNEYSTYEQRVHFTPLWFPDGEYTTFSYIIDFWTPDGMLSKTAHDTLLIKGSVWDDWTVVPAKVD